MASIAPVLTSNKDEAEYELAEARPQAGPLPQKRGEIGFRDSVHGHNIEEEASPSTVVLPARHPADGERSPIPPADSSPGEVSAALSATSSLNVSSTHKASKHAAILSWLDPRPSLNRIKLHGITLITLLRLLFQLVLLGGTIAAWIAITRHLTADSSKSTGDSNNNSTGDHAPAIEGSASIFVHVTFGIAVLAQLLFLERCVFLIRAQRYAALHPGDSQYARSSSRIGMAFAPWNRPSLPTYAAALAQSGYGTGDIEDNVIAIPPPPAYGNTRGSTLLLAGFLRNSLRVPNTMSLAERGERYRGRERPVSYRSMDEEWEERCDVERALRLAETLERLEDNMDTNTRTSH